MTETTTRRRFVAAAIALSGVAGFHAALSAAKAWARDGTAADPESREALVRMARLLYPHDSISDDVYVEVLDQALARTASDRTLASALDAAEQALNASQVQDFVELDVDAQLAAMRRVESSEFFVTIRDAVAAGLYRHPAIWALLHYGGPSADKGGYLHRGAGEIDWLPEAN